MDLPYRRLAVPVELLRTWKSDAEALARLRIENLPNELTGASEFLDVRGTRRRQVVNLSFVGVTDVDKTSVSDVVKAKDEVEIRYFDLIEKALETLQARNRDPDVGAARSSVYAATKGSVPFHVQDPCRPNCSTAGSGSTLSGGSGRNPALR